MKHTTKAILFASVALLSCTKEDAKDNGPSMPIVRHMFATFSTVNNDAMQVRITRATQGSYIYTWANVIGQEYVVATESGQQASIYRNDVVEFIGNVTEPHAIAVRLDDVQTLTVNLDPSMNGQPAYQFTAYW